MNHPRVGEYAADRLRLVPDGSSLLVLAGPHPHLGWSVLRCDPAALLDLVVDHSRRENLADRIADRADGILGDSLRDIDDPHRHWCDWNAPERLALWRAICHTSHVCGLLADKFEFPDSMLAEAVGMLSHLGWLGISCLDPDAVRAVLDDPDGAADPSAVQKHHWGLDADQIRRRMLSRFGASSEIRSILDDPGEDYNEAHRPSDTRVLRKIVRLAHTITASKFGFALGSAAAERPDSILTRYVSERCHESEADPLPYVDPREPGFLASLSMSLLSHRQSSARVHLEREDQHLHAQQELIRQREMLDSDRMESLAEFSAGAAHEINNPLAVISGRTQQLLRREEDADIRRTLEIVLRQTARISSILADLMQFARPDVPNLQFATGLDISSSVRETLRTFALSAGVALTIEADAGVTVLADRTQMGRALYCLVENAIEAAGPGGSAILRQRVCDDRLAFEILDSGSGPDAVARRHMFDPFYSGSPAGRGRGMGLPTAWKLAKLNGGSVRFLPGHPEGTCFVLSLPIVADHELERRQSA